MAVTHRHCNPQNRVCQSSSIFIAARRAVSVSVAQDVQTVNAVQGLPSRLLLDEMAAAKDVDTALTAALKVLPYFLTLNKPHPKSPPAPSRLPDANDIYCPHVWLPSIIHTRCAA